MKKRKPKGRKIYKTKEKNYYGKGAGGKIISCCLTLILMGGVGFVGYSVAGPMLNYDRKTGDNADEIIPAIPAELTTIDSYPDPVAQANEGDTEPEIVNEENISSFRQYRAAAVPSDSLKDTASLRAALDKIPKDENIEYAEIPLKISGGSVLYSSTAYEAQTAGAEAAKLSASEIVNTVVEYGFSPVAVVNCFEDNFLPQSYSEAGFSMGASGELWKNSDDKPQTSPYSDIVLSYNSYIIQEAASSGFEKIICSGLTFPEFDEKALSEMDVRLVSDSERTAVITSDVNYFNEMASLYDAEVIPEYSAAKILTEETILPVSEIIGTDSIIVNICTDELAELAEQFEIKGTPAEITDRILGYISGKTGDLNTVIRISGKDLNYDVLREAKNKAEEYGFSSFVIG